MKIFGALLLLSALVAVVVAQDDSVSARLDRLEQVVYTHHHDAANPASANRFPDREEEIPVEPLPVYRRYA